ncbi:MAG: sensor histidine kinase [Arcicella sp.]|nr:sensor histidine kinase [Arcicella sp.]
MKSAKQIKLLFSVFIISVFIIIGCSKQEDSNNNLYKKPAEEKLDKYAMYLKNSANFFKPNYMSFFNKRYNQLLKENKMDAAAQILWITGTTLDKNYMYDSTFIQTNLRFLRKYEKQIADRYRAGIYSNIGEIYYNAGQYDSATVYLKKSLIKAKDYRTFDNNAFTKYMLIFSYLNSGKSEQSLAAGIQSLQMFDKLKDTSMQAATYSGIACIYRYQEDYPEAMKYENKAFELLKKTADTNVLFVISLNKITMYNDMDDKRLFPFIDSTVALCNAWSQKTIQDTFEINSWLAFKLVAQNKLAEAKIILDKLKPTLSKVNEVGKDYYFNAVSEYEIKLGKGSENIDYYRKRTPELKKNEDYLKFQLFSIILYRDALQKKDYKSAIKYLEQVQIANDSLSNKALRIKTRELDKKYQTEKKEQLIAVQSNELKQKNTFIYALIISLIGLLLAALTYYLWQKQKVLIQDKTNNINFTKQLLENTETERKRIASDLHDSVSHDLLGLKTSLAQDIHLVGGKIDTIINDIRIISRNLHPVMFDKIGLEPNLIQLVERIQEQNDFMVSTDINYSGSLSSADELQIYRIFQEALTNIIKYAKAHAAKITMKEMDDKIFIEIKDNGKGFDVKETLNGGKSFGLHNIIERSRAVGGEANIKSSAEGTIITINILQKS